MAKGRRKISRNAPCPCESGRKYKDCCLKKGILYVEGEEGQTYKVVDISPETADALEKHLKELDEKYGGELDPKGLLFPDAGPLEHFEARTVGYMRKAGIHPAFIHAFEKTGLIVTEENKDKIPDVDLAEWQAAIDEYFRLHGGSADRDL